MKQSLIYLAGGAALCYASASDAGDLKVGAIAGISLTNDNQAAGTADVTLGNLGTIYRYDVAGDSKVGFLIGGVLSYWTESGFIYEAEAAYRRNSYDVIGEISFSANGQTDSLDTTGDSSIGAFTAMANVWYEFGADSGGSVRPYLGGGAGLANIRTSGDVYAQGMALGFEIDNQQSLSENETNLAWQIGGGLNFHLSENSVLSVGYRYLDGGELENGDASKYRSHGIVVGMRF